MPLGMLLLWMTFGMLLLVSRVEDEVIDELVLVLLCASVVIDQLSEVVLVIESGLDDLLLFSFLDSLLDYFKGAFFFLSWRRAWILFLSDLLLRDKLLRVLVYSLDALDLRMDLLTSSLL